MCQAPSDHIGEGKTNTSGRQLSLDRQLPLGRLPGIRPQPFLSLKQHTHTHTALMCQSGDNLLDQCRNIHQCTRSQRGDSRPLLSVMLQNTARHTHTHTHTHRERETPACPTYPSHISWAPSARVVIQIDPITAATATVWWLSSKSYLVPKSCKQIRLRLSGFYHSNDRGSLSGPPRKARDIAVYFPEV